MAAKRDRPFSQFNFLVDIGNGTDSVEAGFQEVSGLGVEINVAECCTPVLAVVDPAPVEAPREEAPVALA